MTRLVFQRGLAPVYLVAFVAAWPPPLSRGAAAAPTPELEESLP